MYILGWRLLFPNSRFMFMYDLRAVSEMEVEAVASVELTLVNKSPSNPHHQYIGMDEKKFSSNTMMLRMGTHFLFL